MAYVEACRRLGYTASLQVAVFSRDIVAGVIGFYILQFVMQDRQRTDFTVILCVFEMFVIPALCKRYLLRVAVGWCRCAYEVKNSINVQNV